MHRIVRRMRAERVQRRQRRQLLRPPQHVRSGALARVLHVLQRRRAQQLGDQLQLLHRALRLEQDAPAEQFAENAAHRPHIDGGRIVARAHQNLGRPIVLGDHLLCHVLRLIRLLDARQSEVADFQHAIAVDEQIAGLDVAMQDACRVQILEAAQDLVQKHLDVVGGEMLRRHDDLVQIGLQQFGYHISAG